MTIDRRGNTDIIIENFDIVLSSDTLQKQLAEWGKPFGLRTTEGSISDVSNIVGALEINGINLFAGYYGAHTGGEYTSMKDLAKSYKFQTELLPLLHNYFTANPDKVKFTDTQKSYTWSQSYYGNYRGTGINSFGCHTGVYSSLSDFDKEDAIDELLETCTAIEKSSGASGQFDDLVHLDIELTKKGKSLRLKGAFGSCPSLMDTLGYYFTVRQDKNQDALIPLKEIRNFKLEASEPVDWDSLGDEYGGY